MSQSPLQEAGMLIVSIVFSIYMTIVLARFLLQWCRADFYNPVSKGVVAATQPVLRPMRRFIPGFGGMDLAALVLLYLLALLKIFASELILRGGLGISIPAWLVLGFADSLDLAITFFLVLIFIVVIMSWLQLFGIAGPMGYNPILAILYALAAIVMDPARRLLPPLGGTLDISPMLALLVLYLLQILVVKSLYALAISLEQTFR